MINKEEKNESEENESTRWRKKELFMFDTCVFYNELERIKELSESLKRGELNGRPVNGKIIVASIVRDEEVNPKYFKLLRQLKEKPRFLRRLFTMRNWGQTKILLEEFKERQEKKQLLKKVKATKILFDKELGQKQNPVWQFKKVTKEIQNAARKLSAEIELYSSVKNPPNDNDLIILATAMELAVYSREPVWVHFVTHDGGIKNAARKENFWYQPSVESLFKKNNEERKGD